MMKQIPYTHTQIFFLTKLAVVKKHAFILQPVCTFVQNLQFPFPMANLLR